MEPSEGTRSLVGKERTLPEKGGGMMRRSKRLALAAIGAVVAGLVLGVPTLVVGAPTTSHGGTPSDVYSTTEPEICAVVNVDGVSALPTVVTVDSTSHLLVSFSSERSGIRGNNELLVRIDILQNGTFVEGTPFDWGFGRTFKTHESGSVGWTFDNIAAGTYTVQVGANMDPAPPGPGGEGHPTATVENCSLTAVVNPVA